LPSLPLFALPQRHGGVDQSEMTVGLRKISKRVTGRRMNLLREKTDVIRVRRGGAKGRVRFLQVSDPAVEKVHLPKTANNVDSFAAR
jgi:hypothetical protein